MALQIAVLSTSRIVAEVMREIGNWPEVEVTAIVCRPQSAEKAHAWAVCPGGRQGAGADGGYHDPLPAAVRLLQAELPKIGEVRGAMASFCARSARYDDYLKGIWNTTFDPACLGGALNDMNVYNLHLLCGLLGVPGRAEYRPSSGPNGIDTAGLALRDYGGFTAAALAAKDSEGRNGMVLQGPGGCLVVEGGTNALPVVYSVLGGVRGGGTRVDGPKPERHRMAYEFAEFARIIAEKDADAEAAARMRTMRVMELLDVLHEK